MQVTVESVDILKDAQKDGFSFVVHNQGNEESCVAHAFTAAHEIIRRKQLRTDDILTSTPWMLQIGALMLDVAHKLESRGQCETCMLSASSGDSDRRPKRQCRSSLKLRFEQIVTNIKKCKKKLAQGLPLVITVREFSLKLHHLTVANRGEDKCRMPDGVLHAVCIYGFVDDEEEEDGGKFLIVNSHGLDWGDQGKGSFSFGYFTKHIYQVYSATMPEKLL